MLGKICLCHQIVPNFGVYVYTVYTIVQKMFTVYIIPNRASCIIMSLLYQPYDEAKVTEILEGK